MHDHSHHMTESVALVAPDWLISSLGVLFLAFAGFYLYRLLRPATVKKAIGFFDWEGEAGHFVCMLAMSSHLVSWLIPIPGSAWIWILGFGTIFYAARAMTWGKLLPYNKQWWDWTHAGMYLGMFTMFQPLPFGPGLTLAFNVAMGIFWTWFSLYYIKDAVLDAKAKKSLSFFSDLAHLGMGLAMLVMTIFPTLLMPGHAEHTGHSGHHHMSMPADSGSPHANTLGAKPDDICGH